MSEPTKELTEAEAKKLRRKAYDLELDVKKAVKEGRKAYWVLAEKLYRFGEERAWEVLGYESVSEWLAQPDIDTSRSSYYRAIQLWRDLALTKQLPPSTLKTIEPSKAREIAPAIIKGKVTPEQAVSDAQSLSYSDVVEKYRSDRIADHGQSPNGDTVLDASRETKWVPCPLCKSRVPESALPPQVPKSAL